LEDLDTAHELAKEAKCQQKWRQLASLATQQGKLHLVQECLHKAEDFAGLLLLATSTGNADMVEKLGNIPF
jgi:coatomer subunit beta'